VTIGDPNASKDLARLPRPAAPGPLQCSSLSVAAELAAPGHAASLLLTESPRFDGSHAHQVQKQRQNQNGKDSCQNGTV